MFVESYTGTYTAIKENWVKWSWASHLYVTTLHSVIPSTIIISFPWIIFPGMVWRPFFHVRKTVWRQSYPDSDNLIYYTVCSRFMLVHGILSQNESTNHNCGRYRLSERSTCMGISLIDVMRSHHDARFWEQRKVRCAHFSLEWTIDSIF